MAEKESIFRKQSIDSVSSPEQLNDYIKAADPGVWLILTAVILLLCGVCVWGIFGRLDTAVSVGAVCEGGELSLYIPEAGRDKVASGMPVTVNGAEYTIASISDSPVLLDTDADAYALHASSLARGDFAYIAKARTELSDGSYEAVITVNSVSPMSFITN